MSANTATQLPLFSRETPQITVMSKVKTRKELRDEFIELTDHISSKGYTYTQIHESIQDRFPKLTYKGFIDRRSLKPPNVYPKPEMLDAIREVFAKELADIPTATIGEVSEKVETLEERVARLEQDQLEGEDYAANLERQISVLGEIEKEADRLAKSQKKNLGKR